MHVRPFEDRDDPCPQLPVGGRVRPDERGRHPIQRLRWGHVHVASHHRRRDRAIAVESDAGTAELAVLVVPETDVTGGGVVLGAEALRRDPPDGVIGRDPVADLLQRRPFDVRVGAVVERDSGVVHRSDERVVELLVGDGTAGDLGCGADVLEDGLSGVACRAGEHRHLRVVLERVDGSAVDRAPGL